MTANKSESKNNIIARIINKIKHILVIFDKKRAFKSSKDHWEQNYSIGRTSGGGSYGKLAEFKAEVLNNFVQKNKIQQIAELGCGDGNQLSLANYPYYTGYDVSKTVIEICEEKFSDTNNWNFIHYNSEAIPTNNVELALSLDVIFHLVEDHVFNSYMENLFNLSTKYIIIYSNNTNENPIVHAPHILHRKFTDWVENNQKSIKLVDVIRQKFNYDGDAEIGSRSDFYIYEK